MAQDAQTAEMERLLQVIQAEKERRERFPIDASGTRSSPSPDGDASTRGTIRTRSDAEGEDNEFPDSVQPVNSSAPYTLEEGRALKRHKNLTPQSEADSDAFLKTAHPMRHAYQVLLVALECRDKLATIERDHNQKYKLSDTLRKTCQDYAHVALLSPKARRYRDANGGPTIARAILASMRAIGVAEIPPPSETGRCDIVIQCLSKSLTDWRCQVKTLVFKSFTVAATENEKSPSRDIASLTRACIGTSSAKPTAPLYQRIAFIRHCAATSSKEKAGSGKNEDNFWHEVDEKLALWRKTSPVEENMQILFDNTYSTDKTLYGEPDCKIPLTLMKDLDAWLCTVNTGMANC
ncbi:hypothetical protein B0H10DRAFT_1952180 [Mycena sp. CBHHK59/15]|nr:hypothetical protein B0H10DRAFT_1952180 [Mycena sp. CBHHK59/15]